MGVFALIPARPASLMPAVGAGEAKVPPGVDSTPLPTAPVPTNPLLKVPLLLFKLSGFACVDPVVPEGPAMAAGKVGVPAVLAEVGVMGPAAACPDTPPTAPCVVGVPACEAEVPVPLPDVPVAGVPPGAPERWAKTPSETASIAVNIALRDIGHPLHSYT